MKNKKLVNGITKVAWVAVIVGALLWGLVALNANIVALLFGSGIMTTIVYAFVGLSGLWVVARKLMGKK